MNRIYTFYSGAIPTLLSVSTSASFTSSVLPVGLLSLSVVITDEGGASTVFENDNFQIEVNRSNSKVNLRSVYSEA